MACCLCMTIPFSSWTAFSVGLISEFGLGFGDYLKAIPFMFYPLCMMLFCLLLAVGVLPKTGVLKQAYDRVAAGGPAFEQDKSAEKLVDISDVDEDRVSSPWNAIVPLAVLVGGTILCGNDLLYGILLTLIAQFLLYVPQKLMTVGQYFEHFFAGAKGMTSLVIVVGLGFVLSDANRELGLFDILINGMGRALPAWLLPVMTFLLVGLTVFAVGGVLGGDDHRHAGVHTAGAERRGGRAGGGGGGDERHRAGVQPVLLRRRSVHDHGGHGGIQHHHHTGHHALRRRGRGAGCDRFHSDRAAVKKRKQKAEGLRPLLFLYALADPRRHWSVISRFRSCMADSDRSRG